MYTSSKYASIDGVGFLIWRHNFKMAAMTSFYAEKCCHLVSAHAASARHMQQRPPFPEWYVVGLHTCLLCLGILLNKMQTKTSLGFSATAELLGNACGSLGEQSFWPLATFTFISGIDRLGVYASRFKPYPHCRRKVRLSQKTARQWRQSLNSATVALFCDIVDRLLLSLADQQNTVVVYKLHCKIS